jgi:hypothetical protein
MSNTFTGQCYSFSSLMGIHVIAWESPLYSNDSFSLSAICDFWRRCPAKRLTDDYLMLIGRG